MRSSVRVAVSLRWQLDGEMLSDDSGLHGMDDQVGRLTYSITEAARALGVSRSYCYELVQQGMLPYLALGRRRVIPRKALQDYIERHTQQDGSAPADGTRPPG